VNGNKVNSWIDPKNIKLNEHDEIAIVYGKPPSNIPSRYSFSQGT
jgi:ribosomal protein S12